MRMLLLLVEAIILASLLFLNGFILVIRIKGLVRLQSYKEIHIVKILSVFYIIVIVPCV